MDVVYIWVLVVQLWPADTNIVKLLEVKEYDTYEECITASEEKTNGEVKAFCGQRIKHN